MIRITTHHEPARTVITIEGRLMAVDLPALRRMRQSASSAVALDLGGLGAFVRPLAIQAIEKQPPTPALPPERGGGFCTVSDERARWVLLLSNWFYRKKPK